MICVINVIKAHIITKTSKSMIKTLSIEVNGRMRGMEDFEIVYFQRFFYTLSKVVPTLKILVSDLQEVRSSNISNLIQPWEVCK